jgi:quinol monooxygenase YgiN
VLAEQGCLEYDLKAIEGNENKFVLVEKWVSEEALEFHDNTDYMQKADSLNHTFRARPAEVIKLVDV